MKTDELVAVLAGAGAAVPANLVARRFAVALGWGMAGALLVMGLMLGLRADLAQALTQTTFWMKLCFAGALALAALAAALRLGRPGMQVGRVWAALASPLLLLWLLAAAVLLDAAPLERAALVFGKTWRSCPFNIAILSLPLLAAALWAMKGLAPTRLALAGASAGLLAGALATLVYALHCPESAPPFVAIWYVLGIAMPTLGGAALGPRLLRW